jgi:beta-ureidopropionase / N-carbamoyl-L-amino-acid hydrolase
VDPRRAIADLRELDRRTGGPAGARRVAWTPEWEDARAFLRERLEDLPVEIDRDLAGNVWAVLPGRSEEIVAVGSHLDSVPAGGWLDGALGVFAGLEVLRSLAAGGEAERTVALVDWADEEGSRFGRSLLGSSAFCGTLDVDAVRELCDADDIALPEALAAHEVDLDRMPRAGEGRRERLAAYLELHIEQGPVLEAEGLPCGAVEGTFGVERWRGIFHGQAAHAGSTPMERRADAGVAAARTIASLPAIARARRGVTTAGRADFEPGIATAVPGRAEVLVDQRHLDPRELEAMFQAARHLALESAEAGGCTFEWEPVWRIDPVPFDPGLVARAAAACAAETRVERVLPSGALHDASELARVVPTTMVFSSSTDGISHATGEDTPERDLEAAIAAFGRLASDVVSGGAA